MSDIVEKLKNGLPDCPCYESERGILLRSAMAGQISRAIGGVFMRACMDDGFCERALPSVMEDVIINLATNIAISGTIIECGSVEAERETVRVLTGIEERLMAKLRTVCEAAREEMARGNIARVDGRGNEIKGGNA